MDPAGSASATKMDKHHDFVIFLPYVQEVLSNFLRYTHYTNGQDFMDTQYVHRKNARKNNLNLIFLNIVSPIVRIHTLRVVEPQQFFNEIQISNSI